MKTSQDIYFFDNFFSVSQEVAEILATPFETLSWTWTFPCPLALLGLLFVLWLWLSCAKVFTTLPAHNGKQKA